MRANASIKAIAETVVERTRIFRIRYERAMGDWMAAGGRLYCEEYRAVLEAKAKLDAIADIAEGLERHVLKRG